MYHDSLFVCLFFNYIKFGLEVGVRAVCSLLLSCGFQELRCLPAKPSHWPLTGSCCFETESNFVPSWPGTLSISGCPQTYGHTGFASWLSLLKSGITGMHCQPQHAIQWLVCDFIILLLLCVLNGGVGQGTTSGVLVPPCWRQGFFVVSLPVQVAVLWVVGIL